MLPRVKLLPGEKMLRDYQFCLDCGKVLVKRVFKRYGFRPFCSACCRSEDRRLRGIKAVPHDPTPSDIALWVKLRRKGLSFSQISEKTGFSASPIKRRLAERGIERGG